MTSLPAYRRGWRPRGCGPCLRRWTNSTRAKPSTMTPATTPSTGARLRGGHQSWGRLDQTPDTESEAGRADEDARGDGDGPVTLGRASHSIRHSRSLERVTRTARTGMTGLIAAPGERSRPQRGRSGRSAGDRDRELKALGKAFDVRRGTHRAAVGHGPHPEFRMRVVAWHQGVSPSAMTQAGSTTVCWELFSRMVRLRRVLPCCTVDERSLNVMVRASNRPGP